MGSLWSPGCARTRRPCTESSTGCATLVWSSSMSTPPSRHAADPGGSGVHLLEGRQQPGSRGLQQLLQGDASEAPHGLPDLFQVLRAAHAQGEVGVELGHGGLVESTFQVVGHQLDQVIAPDVPTRFGCGLHALHDARPVSADTSAVPGRQLTGSRGASTIRAVGRCGSGPVAVLIGHPLDEERVSRPVDVGTRPAAPNETWNRAHQTTTLVYAEASTPVGTM